MFRRFSVNFALLSITLDALAVCLMLSAATSLRPVLGFLPFAAYYPQFVPLPWELYPIIAAEWVAVLTLFSVYNGRRNLDWKKELASLTLGSLLAGMAIAGTLYISYRLVSRLLFLTFVLLTYLAMLLWRGIARLVLGMGNGRFNSQRQVLILGCGEAAQELSAQIQANPNLRLNVIGCLDDQTDRQITGTRLIGPLAHTLEVVQEYKPDDVVIALPQQDYERTNQIIVDLHHLPVKVWLIPDYFRLALHRAAVEEFAGIPMLDLRAPALSDDQRLVKRGFDLLITILSLPFALPAMALIGLAIRLEGEGPVIFGQQRLGENGRLFTMYKFRTMLPGIEMLPPEIEPGDQADNWVHKRADDPRVTRVGRILRRASLDELPQLFNVLRGDMSLVGPRPELPALVDRYEPWQRQRFAAPQGMTGWWQINGRSDRPMHLHTEDDLYYIQHYSLGLDALILLKTAFVVIQGKGAF